MESDDDDLQSRESDLDGRDSSAKCTTIETMPVEIQRQIMLCLCSLGSLGAVIRASPVFYSVFQREPRNFIATCLINVLGHTFFDACTARAAMQDCFQKLRRDGMRQGLEPSVIWPFLASERRKRVEQLSWNKPWIHSISLPKAIGMATFHSSTVEPLVERYASWALANLGVVPPSSAGSVSLSRTERMRIQRGMYRFQIVCDVFGNKLGDDDPAFRRPAQLGCLRLLTCYEPWEIEEILCINHFLREEYRRKLTEISGKLLPLVLGSSALIGEPLPLAGRQVHAGQARVVF
jgi:hypothetical protein